MTEAEYISEFKRRWPRDEETTLETLALADEAVRAFPTSARLWVVRGNLIQLGSESSPHSLEDALASYQRAIEVAPEFAEAWEEVGYYYDAVLDDEATARKYFQEAARLRQAPVA
jgi:tetratricopeptide (TPR) repeat protein